MKTLAKGNLKKLVYSTIEGKIFNILETNVIYTTFKYVGLQNYVSTNITIK